MLGVRVEERLAAILGAGTSRRRSVPAYQPGPGLPLASAQEELTRVGFTDGAFLAGAKLFEVRALDDIDLRQRLVVGYARGRVARTALIIELEDVGDVDTTSQTFERIREILIQRYGAPARTFVEGSFTDSFEDDVNSDWLIRTVEWDRPSGVLRYGIPRRLDRQVRLEIQFAPGFPPPRQTLWSVEAVR